MGLTTPDPSDEEKVAKVAGEAWLKAEFNALQRNNEPDIAAEKAMRRFSDQNPEYPLDLDELEWNLQQS